MKTFVLHASVALGWTLDNPLPVSAAQAKQALLSGARALVPALWHLEIANGLVVAERRGFSLPPTPHWPSGNWNSCARKLSISTRMWFLCGRRGRGHARIVFRPMIRFIWIWPCGLDCPWLLWMWRSVGLRVKPGSNCCTDVWIPRRQPENAT